MRRYVLFGIAIVALITTATTVLAAPAHAIDFFTSSNASCRHQQLSNGQFFDPIQSGLWGGTDMDVSGLYSAGGDHVSNDGPCPGDAPSTTPTTKTTTPKSTSGNGTYAALGDSVAAGVGLPTVVQVTADEQRCGRTQEAYPYAVAAATNLTLIHAACSGATAGDLYTKQRSGSPNLPPQLNAAFKQGTPSLITITAGANDAHWTGFLSACYYSNCATATQTSLANAYLVALQAKLLALFPIIQARSHGHPPSVIVTGYYNPISPACVQLSQKITTDEVAWMTAEVNSLNATIKGVVDVFHFAHFTSIDFTGHDICSNDPWVQGLQDPRPFHPTVTGQQAMAESIIAVTSK